MVDKTDQRQIKVLKGLGTRMKYFPPKRTEGLQRWANPAPTNNTNNPDRKAQDEAHPNTEQD